ncbi:MAG: glutathione-disulfide reductase [Bauldia sp.]|nr:glutathione-disulfide reductase [Bauldia sp.]
MAEAFDYDLFVIGGGSGGVRAARISGRHGARVALAESSRVGGTCVIRGCVPKKLMAYAARFRDAFEDSVGYGFDPGEPTFDWAKLIANKDREIDRINAAYIRGLEAAGVAVLHDRAVLVSPNRVRLVSSGREVTAANILIATGGHPNLDTGIPGGDLAISSDEMFHLPALPRAILIVGAGYVAVEFAGIMNGLGAETTILHRGNEILRPFDVSIRDAMHAAMEKRGITIRLGDRLASIERTSAGLLARTRGGAEIEADNVLMAIGRTPNTRGIGLAEAGVRLDDSGAIIVDDRHRTSVPNIYAIGDVSNRINLTPVAIREGHAVADNLFGGKDVIVDHSGVPHAVFGIPEIGAVGLTEEEAKRDHAALDFYETVFNPMRNQLSGRDERVHIKLIVDTGTDRILGCHILGDEAPELIQLMAVALKLGATKAGIDATMALHPTVAEEIVTIRTPSRRWRRDEMVS